MTGIGIVGCGFVADYYLQTMGKYPQLKIVGVMDRNRERADTFGKYYDLPVVDTLDELISNPEVKIILNLTNPKSHFEVSKASLEYGKHVYTEKPMAMSIDEAKELHALAESKGLMIVSAPCSLLGESAQTLSRALFEGVIGKPRIVYAEIDDGPIYKMDPQNWKSPSGAPWPAEDEYEVGCTLEHAGYYLSWLAEFFGSAVKVTAFGKSVIEGKGTDTPDFTVSCIEFETGVVARFTCGIVAPVDHSLKIVGDDGVLMIEQCWHNSSPVKLQKYTPLGLKASRFSFIRKREWLGKFFGIQTKKIPFVSMPDPKARFKRDYMDFSRGVAELADALSEKRPCRLSPKFCLHFTEMILAIEESSKQGKPYTMTTKI